MDTQRTLARDRDSHGSALLDSALSSYETWLSQTLAGPAAVASADVLSSLCETRRRYFPEALDQMSEILKLHTQLIDVVYLHQMAAIRGGDVLRLSECSEFVDLFRKQLGAIEQLRAVCLPDISRAPVEHSGSLYSGVGSAES
jgi:hypothetical protein